MQPGRTEGKTDYARGFALATVGVVVLSPDSLLVRLIETDVWTLLFWRGLLAALALGVILGVRYRSATPEILHAIGRLGVVAALLMAASTVLFVTSIRTTSVANTLVILSAAPLFAAVLARVFLSEAVSAHTWTAVITVFVGIAIIFAGGLGGGTLLGDLSAVGAAFTFASAFVIFRHARGVDMAPTLVLMGLILAVGVSPLASPLAVDARAFAYLLILGVVVLPVSFVLIVAAPRYIPAPDATLITLLEAVIGPLWVWLVLAEVPARETFFGGALILGTLILRAAAGLRKGR
jgi:drug/metabolite transporter (DMT)-like permease